MPLDAVRVKSLFVAASELPAPERPAFLDHECAGDGELRARVQELLVAHDQPATVEHASAPAPERPGTRIGPYKLLEIIGEGGMGVVWMAEQQEPIRRLVALKIIKEELDAGRAGARFEAERQALALMDHPNIARVFDAGTTENGRPFFVMELVKGVPITQFCDERKLTPRERLELFVPVCQAVQHAHQKGVIHRDLKPSNILIALYDGRPVPKVIDFGIAKATGQRLTEKTLYTAFGTVVGTVEYMSPEQAELNQLDIDTRSDVYSLGVLLYELLTGSTPLDRAQLANAGLLEMLRQVREEDPPKPSARLSGSATLPAISARCGTEAAKLPGLVRGELDWIVMKALEKDRTRRYETANGLAQDVRRYLADEPVEACPPSLGYRVSKFLRKHRAAFTLAVTAVTLLVLGAAVASWQAWRATTAERDALAKADVAEKAQQKEADALAGAEKATKEARWQLARQYVSRGWGELEKGDVLASLPWYVEALALEEEDPLRAEVHRLRLGELLRYCPRVKQVFYHEGGASSQPSDDVLYVMAVRNLGGGFHGLDVASGKSRSESKGWLPDGLIDIHPGCSPDGRRFAARTRGGIGVYELPSGKLLATIDLGSGQLGYPYHSIWHPSGKSLLILYPTGIDKATFLYHTLAARLFDATTGKPLAPEVKTKDRFLFHARFSPDGKLLATVTQHGPRNAPLGGSIIVLNIETFRSSEKTSAHLRDARTGEILTELPGDDITHLEFNPQGESFATGHKDGTVRLWDVATHKAIKTFAAGGPFPHLHWSADGRHLLIGDEKRSRWLTRAGEETGAQVELPSLVVRQGPGRMGLVEVQEKQLVPGSDPLLGLMPSGYVSLWHPLQGKQGQGPIDQTRFQLPINQFPLQRIACIGKPESAQLAPDGRTLLTSNQVGLVHLWDVGVRACDRNGRVGKDLPVGMDVPEEMYSERVSSPDGKTQHLSLLAIHQDFESVGELRFSGGKVYPQGTGQKRLFLLRESETGIWELRGYEVPSLKESFPPIDLGKILPPQNVHHQKLAELRPGLLYVECRLSQDTHEVRFFDEGKPLGKIAFGSLSRKPFRPNIMVSGPVTLAFNKDRSTMAAVWQVEKEGKPYHLCRAWSLPDLKPRFEAIPLEDLQYIFQAEVSADGRYLSLKTETKDMEKTGQIIDLTRGTSFGVLPPRVWPSGFLPDGRLVARTPQGTRVWDFRTGKPLTLPMEDADFFSFGQQGSHILFSELDRDTLSCGALYDTQTGERITVPATVGNTWRKHFPPETRSVEQLRLLASVLSGRRLDTTGAVVSLGREEYLAAWNRLCVEMPEARRLSAEEELDWHRDEAGVAESWQDWTTAERHCRVLVERAPKDGNVRQQLANILAEQGRWADARNEYLAAADVLTNPFHVRVEAAWLSLASGDREHLHRDLAALLRDHEKTASTVRALKLLTLAILDGDADTLKHAVSIVRRLQAQPDRIDKAWAALAEGLAGPPTELLAKLNAVPKREGIGGPVEAHNKFYPLLCVVALQRAGEAREATARLEQMKGSVAGHDWRERLILRLLSAGVK